jgi:3-isopropylmalate dehydrogenase
MQHERAAAPPRGIREPSPCLNGTGRTLASALPEPPVPLARHLVGALPGEGVGPDLVALALRALEPIAAATGTRFEVRTGGAIGTTALRHHGRCLTDEVAGFCSEVFSDGGAVFCGAGGGRFVYELRSRFDLFCKFTPIAPLPALRDAGPLRPEILEGTDIVAVRENVGGLYSGTWSTGTDAAGCPVAHHSFSYAQDAVDRILDVAARVATARSGRLTVVTKPGGVPAISELWEDRARALGHPGLRLELLEVDNAAYQIAANPRRFDVIAAPNMFGDVIADCGALLLASRGMSFSGNFGPGGRAVYQTGHGAAYDIAGSGLANPCGQLNALAMMLRESFGLAGAADALLAAIAATLAEGFRTPDIAGPTSRVVGTAELGDRILAALPHHLSATAGATPCAPRSS